jgi:hypothetical protein
MSAYGERRCANPRNRMIALISLASKPTGRYQLKTEQSYEMVPRCFFAHVAKVYEFDRVTKMNLIQMIPPCRLRIEHR